MADCTTKRKSGAPGGQEHTTAQPGGMHGIYVCIYGPHISQSMDQPGKVANPARGQLNRENDVPVCACEFGLAGRVQPSCPKSAWSFSILRLIWRLLTGFLPICARRPFIC